MKKFSLLLLSVFFLTACSDAQATSKTSAENSTSDKTAVTTKSSSMQNSKIETQETLSSEKESTSNTVMSSEQSNDESIPENKDDKYYSLIKKAQKAQQDYIDSITDSKVKQSVQTAFAAANAEASSLEMENPEDSKIIQESLKKVLEEN